MALFKFANFQFNNQNYILTRGKIRQELRPKTGLLLAYLIAQRNKVIAKKEIFEAVWQTEHVQDHTLFQVISEIRKLAPELELIRTQPNLGYQWVIETSLVNINKTKNINYAIAACIASCLSISLYVNLYVKNGIKTKATPTTLIALSAYSKGVLALEQGDHQDAEKWLTFSLAENPTSVETQLLLAESLFQQNNLIASESYVRQIINESIQSSYHYVAASDLLSRIYQQQGLVFDALMHALNGANSLQASRSACSIQAVDQRIQKLLEIIDTQPGSNLKSNKLANDIYKEYALNKIKNQHDNSTTENFSDLCEQLTKPIKNDLSARCISLQETKNLFVFNNKPGLNITS